MRTILTIWTQPRKTFEYLDKNEGVDPGVNLNVLFYLGALSMMIHAIPEIVGKYKTNDEPVAYLIIVVLIVTTLGALFGAWIFKYVHSYVLWKVGKVFEGKASKSQVQLVIAYSLIPGLISLLISAVLIIVAVIRKDINIVSHQNPLTLFIIWVFGVRTLIYGLARFNKFSYGYAMINICVVAIIVQGIALGIKYLMH